MVQKNDELREKLCALKMDDDYTLLASLSHTEIDKILNLTAEHTNQLLDRVEKEVINEDEPRLETLTHKDFTNDRARYARNNLRATQREALQRIREGKK